jgi:hypothetical protein
LPGLVAVAGAGAAVIGLLWRPSGHPVSVVTARGQPAQLAGDGLYRYDTVFIAAGNTAVDTVVLALGIPLVVAAWLQFRAGSPRGSLLLTGALGFLLYVYATYAFGVAYNPLFLAYVALLAAACSGSSPRSQPPTGPPWPRPPRIPACRTASCPGSCSPRPR